jgi:hypothetical protein
MLKRQKILFQKNSKRMIKVTLKRMLKIKRRKIKAKRRRKRKEHSVSLYLTVLLVRTYSQDSRFSWFNN